MLAGMDRLEDDPTLLPPSPPKIALTMTTILGNNVSSRSWKNRSQKRASSIRKTTKRTSWSTKQAAQSLHKATKQLQDELVQDKKQAILEKKERKVEQEKRRMENELQLLERSAQTLNHSKLGTTLKALSKKQLRHIKKSRMNAKTGVVEYVPAYAK